MFLRLDPTLLDGSSVLGFDSLTTTIGVPAVTPAWKGQPRILPKDPAHSLLYQLISHRGTGQQMPPIATNFVDQADIPLVEAWIAQLPAVSTGSGGNAGFGGNAGAANAGSTGLGGSAGQSGGGASGNIGGSAGSDGDAGDGAGGSSAAPTEDAGVGP